METPPRLRGLPFLRSPLLAAADPLNSDALLGLATDLALQAGAVLLARQGDSDNTVEYKTTDTDPVSEADRAAERLITEGLARLRPDDGLLGEEGARRTGSSGLRWIIDPLDGTVNYLYGHAAFAVSIACEAPDGAAVVGVVHQPATARTFAARRGGGATLDGRPLRVNDPVALSRALVGTGFAYDPVQRRRQAGIVARLLPVVRDIRRIGSAALDLCMVAAGELDAYYEDTTQHWDWAAGALIATEAGAVVRRAGDGIIAAGPALLTELERLFASVGDAQGDGGLDA